jgi:hypothetical protein
VLGLATDHHGYVRARCARIVGGPRPNGTALTPRSTAQLPRARLGGEPALRLVYLYAEKESAKFEKAALKWLQRYLDEKSPTLKNFAKVVRSLEQRQLD